MAQGGLHEAFDREEEVQGSSERSFGLVFAAVFALIGAVKLWTGGQPLWWLGPAAAFLGLAFLWPAPLRPLNRLWLKLALLLYKIVNPAVMMLLYALAIVPIGLVLRTMGKDLLRLKRDPAAKTYWIARDPPGPKPETMKNQF